MKSGLYRKYIKRLIDIILSSVAIIVFGIPLLIVAVLVRIQMGSPVLFKQRRIGKDCREFELYKFRTMTEARDENGIYLPDPDRLTSLGNIIRATSIDELPSLLNILKGEMSVIGPRPLPVRYLDRYTPRQLRRHEVRPGLSSPSTINGRNLQDWEEQFENDVWYVENLCFPTDVKCIFNTLKVVFTREGSTSQDGDARREFIGTADINSLRDEDNNYMKL